MMRSAPSLTITWPRVAADSEIGQLVRTLVSGWVVSLRCGTVTDVSLIVAGGVSALQFNLPALSLVTARYEPQCAFVDALGALPYPAGRRLI